MKKVGIFGGSFNPVHNGHLVLADFIRNRSNLDEIWFVLSPLNPIKENPAELLPDDVRFAMLRRAVDPIEHFIPSDIELTMPRPSYTVDTLRKLTADNPDTEFYLIIGADNYASFDRWKNPDEILSLAQIIVYPRPGIEMPEPVSDRVQIADAPLIDISSTQIRRMLSDGESVNLLVPDAVYNYIVQHQLYK